VPYNPEINLRQLKIKEYDISILAQARLLLLDSFFLEKGALAFVIWWGATK
jgi:hypothetical protein